MENIAGFTLVVIPRLCFPVPFRLINARLLEMARVLNKARCLSSLLRVTFDHLSELFASSVKDITVSLDPSGCGSSPRLLRFRSLPDARAWFTFEQEDNVAVLIFIDKRE